MPVLSLPGWASPKLYGNHNKILANCLVKLEINTKARQNIRLLGPCRRASCPDRALIKTPGGERALLFVETHSFRSIIPRRTFITRWEINRKEKRRRRSSRKFRRDKRRRGTKLETTFTFCKCWDCSETYASCVN